MQIRLMFLLDFHLNLWWSKSKVTYVNLITQILSHGACEINMVYHFFSFILMPSTDVDFCFLK